MIRYIIDNKKLSVTIYELANKEWRIWTVIKYILNNLEMLKYQSKKINVFLLCHLQMSLILYTVN